MRACMRVRGLGFSLPFYPETTAGRVPRLRDGIVRICSPIRLPICADNSFTVRAWTLEDVPAGLWEGGVRRDAYGVAWVLWRASTRVVGVGVAL
jgi:hypothetical protein